MLSIVFYLIYFISFSHNLSKRFAQILQQHGESPSCLLHTVTCAVVPSVQQKKEKKHAKIGYKL